MNILIRQYKNNDLDEMIDIWNSIVKEGNAFPQDTCLNIESGKVFFESQTYCGVCELDKKIVGLYILHPNNIGRCSHLSNASYAVDKNYRGQKIGEALVKDCIKMAKIYNYKILQFNAVVATNVVARNLYNKLGFTQLGVIPKGFKMLDGHFEDICPYYIEL